MSRWAPCGNVLFRIGFLSQDPPSEAFQAAALTIIEINDDNRGAANVVFDPDDIDAAFAELDARYLAGEAAAHSDTWSVISQAYLALNRRALPATTPGWTSIDHRRFGTVEANALTPNIRAWWDLTSEARIDVETVHQLTSRGAVVAHASHATWHEGAEIESGEIVILMVDDDLLSRCELFDEADIEAALARFEELHLAARRLENAATQVYERLHAYFVIRDWAAITEILGDGYYQDDGRPVVGGGIRRGRNALIQDLQAAADLGVADATSNTIAIRGERLALTRVRYSRRDEGPEPFHAEFLQIVEIDADARIAVLAALDLDHVDTAFEQLDARYLAGEAAAHSHTWSVIAGAFAEFNQHELPLTTPDSVYIDRRPVVGIVAVDLAASLRALWELAPDIRVYVEAVHRLSELGAVVTQALKGTSHEGFYAEWRWVDMLTVEGDLISRAEIFDEADIDAAIARFEELHSQARRLENTASQVTQRFLAHFAAGDWDAVVEMLGDGFSQDDRRRVVGAGVRHGRDAEIVDLRAIASLRITELTSTVMATRGERLTLLRCRFAFRDHGSEAFVADVLGVAEINADELIIAAVSFDLDDIDAAFKELDARYLAGEAADHAQTWSVIVETYAAFNRHELSPTTPDWVNIDHRRGIAFAPGDMTAYIRAGENITPDNRIYIETVDRLSHLGAVVTQVMKGTSRDGFDAEWREIGILTVEGDLINRGELFDEADLDAALARFDELHSQTRRLENAASRMDERLRTFLAAREWAAMANLLTEDTSTDDRRRIVNVGLRRGRDVTIAQGQAMADLGVKIVTSDVVAIRGERLFLSRARWLGPDQQPEDFHTEVLNVVEIDSEERIAARVMFDPDDIDAAFEELDARYVAGEAAAHAQTCR